MKLRTKPLKRKSTCTNYTHVHCYLNSEIKSKWHELFRLKRFFQSSKTVHAISTLLHTHTHKKPSSPFYCITSDMRTVSQPSSLRTESHGNKTLQRNLITIKNDSSFGVFHRLYKGPSQLRFKFS